MAGFTESNQTTFTVNFGPDKIYNGGVHDAFVTKITANFFTSTDTFSLTPRDSQVAVGQHLPLTLTWTVPKHEVWTDLKTIQLRFKQDKGVALWVQWDQEPNTFRLVDPDTGQLGPPASPGASAVLETTLAALYLAETSVQGGGPKAPNVDLNLSLAFKPPTKGRTFAVDVAASDDFGNQDPFAPAGTVAVGR